MNLISDEEYNKKMNELGLFEDKEYERFFLGDMAFLMNVDDNINELGDLIQFQGNHPTYLSQTLMDFSMSGAELVIGPGAIDEYGIKHQKALYCVNYKKIYSNKNEERNLKSN